MSMVRRRVRSVSLAGARCGLLRVRSVDLDVRGQVNVWGSWALRMAYRYCIFRDQGVICLKIPGGLGSHNSIASQFDFFSFSVCEDRFLLTIDRKCVTAH
jgi:hypothetical protein